MITLGWVWAALWLGACTPDETGYGDPDDTANDAEVDDGSAAGSDAPSFDPEDLEGRVFYTALRELAADERLPVTLLAVPGTFPGIDRVTVRVIGGDQAGVDTVEGGFVVTVQAALGDVAQLLNGDVSLGTLNLSYDLSAVEAPGAADQDLAEDDMAGALAPAGDGVQVGDGQVNGVAAPYLAYNSTSGAVRLVDAGDLDVVLPAVAGDVICVAQLDASDRPGPAVCAVF